MKRLCLTLTALAPLAIGHRKPGSVSEALDYIPGSVLRGAIAQRLLQQGQPEAGDDFHGLFLEDTAAVFTNAYPATYKRGEDDYAISARDICHLPTTALSTKTNSGFKPKKAGVFDALIDSYCAREHGLFYEPNDVAGDRVEPFTGIYSQGEDHPVSHTLNKRLLTRVGLNRRRATAQDEILYSLEVMNESQGKETPVPTTYRGAILISQDELAEPLQTFLEHHRDRFRLGGSASRGLGQVAISTALEDCPVPVAAVGQRIAQFNQALHQRWQVWHALGAPDPDPLTGRLFFAITLQADAILTETWRRTMVLSPALLSQHTGLPAAQVTLEMAYSSYGYRTGWNAAWGLPKDVEMVTQMGSVFLYSIPNSEEANWIESLAQLERTGIGDRTREGFGQIKVCDEFHQVMREDAV
jgi:CRISPR-associated protein Csx10